MVIKSKMTGLIICAIAALLFGSATAQVPDCSGGVNFVPHPTDCTLYYACTGGEAILQECPDGLWWNPNLNACDWPADSGCLAGSSTTPSTSSVQPSTETSTIDPPSTETTGVPTESTSSDISTETTPGISTETTSGIPTETTPAVSTETTTTTTPTTTTPTTTTPTTTSESPELPQECPAVDDPENPVRLPHETRCEWYYLCIDGAKVLYACTDDHQFSYSQRFCFPPDEAGCDRCPTVDTGDIIRLPHESDCHLYYLCVDSSPVLHQCAVVDDDFSRTARVCMAPEDAQCSLGKTLPRWF